MEVVIVVRQRPDPGDGQIVEVNDLDNVRLKKDVDQCRSCVPVVLLVKPGDWRLLAIFAE